MDLGRMKGLNLYFLGLQKKYKSGESSCPRH